ncbi:nuclear transport factor 2 family protein [Kibdelosporangium philippinense]|uniref:Nuclear transport factor 2 family protein n=1 Tax=Kibdelosporangium philippinense TaxID=211113 RepID=A0ABS8ZHA5_9PSEU|nr:nuclear transport factor 2 family protein [Kibdelosporangium philippinense]MCE7007191.1 nuclear transport factor 2 family protein [Kibdelosporangium philippinense]
MRIHLAVATVFLLAACGTTSPPPTTNQPPPVVTSGSSAPSVDETLSEADRAAAPGVAQRFLDAANAGDSAGVAATFAENARFDSVGRIYPSRKDIMDRFLDPEVIRVGGKYEATGTRWDGNRYVVDYKFTTRGGGGETFNYAYLVREGLIQDVIGRY